MRIKLRSKLLTGSQDGLLERRVYEDWVLGLVDSPLFDLVLALWVLFHGVALYMMRMNLCFGHC